MAGDKSLPGELRDQSANDAATRGNQIHLMLEHLPRFAQKDWPQIAEQMLPEMANAELTGPDGRSHPCH